MHYYSLLLPPYNSNNHQCSEGSAVPVRAFFPLYVSIILELSEHLEHLERNHHVIANLEHLEQIASRDYFYNASRDIMHFAKSRKLRV